MTLVLDASIALAWQFGDENVGAVQDVLADVVGNGAVVPALWRFEVANGLTMAMRRGRIDEDERNDALTDLSDLEIELDEESAERCWSITVTLAQIYRLTVYDAAYLELAQRRRLPLATLDQALANAARAAGIELRI